MAMMIPEETINKVRQATNITDVVSQYVQLKKKGKNLFGFCPFHDERTPSFSVTEEKQIFHCFSCGRGGNVFTFLMEVDGLSFPEAVIKTAEISQIELEESLINDRNTNPQATDSKKELLLKAHEESLELFHHILLNTKIGEQALAYLTDRGLTREVIETFGIGFAPRERTMLHQYLIGKDYQPTLLKESGLFVERDNGELLDRFYNRIIFPIRNQQGKVVAFSGRIFEVDDHEDGPKYLNSPETYLFNKRNVLFNYDKARAAIRREKEVVLFEGFMDVIAAWQAGVQNGVASMGTSLTNEQIHMLDRVTDHVLIAYDSDNAGIEAAKRAADLLSEQTDFDIEILSFSEGMDPDDFIKENGAAAFKELLSHGRTTLFGFKMRYFRRSLNLANESERLGYIEKILTEMLTITSAVEREMYFKQLAAEFDVSLDSLKEQFQKYFYEQRNERAKETKRNTPSSPEIRSTTFPQVQNQRRKIDSTERAEQLLLNRLFHFEEAWIQLKNLPNEFHFVHDDYQMLYILYESFLDHAQSDTSIEAFIDFVKESSLKSKLVEIELLSVSEEMTAREIEDYIDVISRKSILQSQLKEKQEAMTEASRRGDQAQLRTLMIEVVNLSRSLKNS
ncbi:DNA primase [Carnobacterium sp. CS13]|nr:DNA primase [Carnobacterium sp. CP1]QQP71342.1 DNA primase [Carnobacterium sp. CS13]